MKEALTYLWVFLFGAGGLALIDLLKEIWRFRAERKAKKEDKAAEKKEAEDDKSKEIDDKLDEMRKEQKAFFEKQGQFNKELSARVEKLEDQNEAQNEGMKYTLLDRILYLGQHYINDGEVSFDDRKRLGDMHTVYHSRLGGNGDADAIMESVYELPLKK